MYGPDLDSVGAGGAPVRPARGTGRKKVQFPRSRAPRSPRSSAGGVRLSPTGKANGDLYPKYLVHSILRPKIRLQRRTQRRHPFCVGTEWEGKKTSSFSATQNTAEREGGATDVGPRHRGRADGGRWRRGCRRGARIRPATIEGSRGRRPGAPAKADPGEVAASGSAPSASLCGSPASGSHPRRRRGEACPCGSGSSGVVCTCAQIRRGRWRRGWRRCAWGGGARPEELLPSLPRIRPAGSFPGAPAFSSPDPAGSSSASAGGDAEGLRDSVGGSAEGSLEEGRGRGAAWRQREDQARGDRAGAGAAPPARSAANCSARPEEQAAPDGRRKQRVLFWVRCWRTRDLGP